MTKSIYKTATLRDEDVDIALGFLGYILDHTPEIKAENAAGDFVDAKPAIRRFVNGMREARTLGEPDKE